MGRAAVVLSESLWPCKDTGDCSELSRPCSTTCTGYSGVWHRSWGSSVFFERLFHPRRIVAVDIAKEEVAALRSYDKKGAVIRPYFGTSQADQQRLDEIIGGEFPSGLDLVVDDASHMYALSQDSFDVAFRHLRPGGRYILEDWSWSFEAASQSEQHPWYEKPSLANLVFEWIVGVGSRAGIAHVSILPGLAIAEKGGVAHSASREEWTAFLRDRSLGEI